ncbi:MAG: NADH-quinone oxidoreductase subunit D [Anaerolineales bacterium]|jgi:NADH:ubiquinone oxidoreductase subunit D/NADH:ubiquinone oxidoreductase subunit C
MSKRRKAKELDSVESLEGRFPGELKKDERQGYQGYLVSPGKLQEFATAVRDELGYDYLASVTGVDYLPEDMMEVVYHASRTLGGPPLVFKTQVPRANPEVPSLVSIYPGADLQEREAWDLLGIHFADHPNLKRILTWEGFHGHPLRKDWQEPYFEQEDKPFKSRWPEGEIHRSEDKAPFAKNVQYPDDFTAEGWTPEGEASLYAGMGRIEKGNGRPLETDTLVVNMGPQHPSTHGVFRMVVTLDGETITQLKPVVGYLHRNHEKIGERNTYIMNMPFTDRLDYMTSMSNNFGYALAVEKLMGVQPPERAEYIRVMMAELTRIVSHVWAIGFLLNDLGAYFTPMLYAMEERELIVDIFEAVSGSRLMCNYFRFGGVARDLPEGILDTVRELVLERLPRKIDELDTYLTNNEIVRSRCIGVGVLPTDKAIALSSAGPILRASGVPYDIRKADPYSIYDRFDFDIAVRPNGDIYDRYLVRLDEIHQSLHILRQVLRDIPEGEIQTGRPRYQVRVPAGEAYGRVEGPKGELGFYVVSDGTPTPWRYHIRAPSFINITSLEEMCIDQKIADVVAVVGSIDIVLGEVDR